jgi:transketolase
LRTGFFKALLSRAIEDDRVFLIVGDLGFSVVEEFQHTLPSQFMNAGIAEQNMLGLAAGMANEGFKVFVYSIGNFPTFRAAEQIRNDIDYHNLAVNIVAVGGGLGYGPLGYSHHAIQDMALMRLFPNVRMVTPTSDFETIKGVDFLIDNPGPSYLRLDKSPFTDLGGEAPARLISGTWRPLQMGGGSTAVLAVGGGIRSGQHFKITARTDADLFSMPLWGRGGNKLQVEQVSRYSEVFVFEDHLRAGGFGSWLMEAVSETRPDLLSRIRVRALSDDVLGRVGTQDYLEELGGLWRNDS